MKISLKQILFGVVIGAMIVAGYFLVPGFYTTYLINPIVSGASWFALDFVMYAPLQFFSAIGLTAFILLAGHRIWDGIKSIGYKKTVQPIYQNQPVYQQPQPTYPTLTTQPVAVAPQPSLEIKKEPAT